MTLHSSAARRSGAPLRIFLSVLMLALCAGCSSSDAKTATNNGPHGDGGGQKGPDPKLPAEPADCPDLVPGHNTVTVRGQQVEIWAGEKLAKPGPIVFYWHGSGSHSGEAALLGPALQEIQDMGGLVASFESSLGTGGTTGNLVWYTDDYLVADDVLMCAIKQLNIDTHRIYAAGCSAGGLQSGSMVLARSSYLAAAMSNSGGDILVSTFQDESHIPALITAHGSCADQVFVHFANWSLVEDRVVSGKGGVAVDCNHGLGHCGAPADLIAAQWQFLKDHPFGVSPDPYAGGLPSSFPSYCRQFPIENDDGGVPCPGP